MSYNEIRQTAVDEHNKYRRKHGASDVKGNNELHDEAQLYADYLAARNTFEPARTRKYGENLASSHRKKKLDAIKDVVQRWYETRQFYDYEQPGFNCNGKPTGTFTAMVWKNVTHIGFGIAWNDTQKQWICVCYYTPPPNTPNKFKENVLLPRTLTTTTSY